MWVGITKAEGRQGRGAGNFQNKYGGPGWQRALAVECTGRWHKAGPNQKGGRRYMTHGHGRPTPRTRPYHRRGGNRGRGTAANVGGLGDPRPEDRELTKGWKG